MSDATTAGQSNAFEGVRISAGRRGGWFVIDAADTLRVTAYRWRINRRGYIFRRLPDGSEHRCVYLHRWLLDAPAGVLVDHRNGDRGDNRRSNLRLCTHAENIRNQRHRVGGSSQWRGVTLDKRTGKWLARIKVDYRGMHLGSFVEEADAARAYDVAATEHFGEFARLNFPSAA